MQIDYHRKFKKAFKKQPQRVQTAFYDSLELFLSDPEHHSLHNHSLAGKYKGMYSFNVTWDIRVLYRQKNDDVIQLLNISTHAQLYG